MPTSRCHVVPVPLPQPPRQRDPHRRALLGRRAIRSRPAGADSTARSAAHRVQMTRGRLALARLSVAETTSRSAEPRPTCATPCGGSTRPRGRPALHPPHRGPRRRPRAGPVRRPAPRAGPAGRRGDRARRRRDRRARPRPAAHLARGVAGHRPGAPAPAADARAGGAERLAVPDGALRRRHHRRPRGGARRAAARVLPEDADLRPPRRGQHQRGRAPALRVPHTAGSRAGHRAQPPARPASSRPPCASRLP